MYKFALTLLTLIAHLPLKLMYLVSDFAFVVLYYVVKYRRKVVAANLKLAFPDATEQQRKRWERQFYRHLCDVFVEAVKLLHISDKEVDKRIEIIGAELVDDNYRAGRSTVLLLGHYANWEWVTAIIAKFQTPVMSSEIYHPLSNKTMDRIMLKIRSRFKGENIPMARAVRRLLEIERTGNKFVCGFIADQRPRGKVLEHWTDFMGIDTPYIIGGETIGERVGAGYLYIDMEKISRGHYRITFKPIEVPEGDTGEFPVTRQYLRMLEGTIRRAPQYWLWSHRRWSRKHAK